MSIGFASVTLAASLAAHTSLGPGVPDAPDRAAVPSGHQIREGHRVAFKSILGGLHHEYRLERRAA